MQYFVPKKNIRGFTLVEMLLVVFLVATLATVAISSYLNSTDTFKFLQGYKQVMSTLRTARSYAITNKQQNDSTPKHYGVCLSQDRAIVFADSGQNELIMEMDQATYKSLSNNGLLNVCGFAQFIPKPAGQKFDDILLEKNFRFDDKGYLLKALDANPAPGVIAMPIFLYYESGSGDLTIYDGNGLLLKKDVNRYINLEFSEKNGDAKKYIRLFQVSGLAEEEILPI